MDRSDCEGCTARAQIAALERELEQVKQELHFFQEQLDRLLEEIARDRKRITALENDQALSETSQKKHLDKLYTTMLTKRIRRISVADAARVLGVSLPHAYRIAAGIENDDRFYWYVDSMKKSKHYIAIKI